MKKGNGHWQKIFGATNSAFNITKENNNFSISTPGYWSSRGGADTIYNPQNLSKVKSQNDIEVHVKEVETRGNQITIGDRKYKLSDRDTHKNEIFEDLKKEKYNDLPF